MEKFLFIYKPSLYNRFIDDIFVILDHFFDINILKNFFGNLKLNIVCHTIVNFLDLIISLNPNSGSLSFSLYTKPTNTFSYLLSSSNHQKSIFENIPTTLLKSYKSISRWIRNSMYVVVVVGTLRFKDLFVLLRVVKVLFL